MIATLTRMRPLEFVIPERLDLVIKWRYFLHLNDGSDPESTRLYLWHINARTGGIEPGGGKSTLAAYMTHARALQRHMKAHGFNDDHPIRVGTNGRLMDGAHRIACALALGVRRIPVVTVDKPGRARDWGAACLTGHGIDPDDLARLEADFKVLTA
jgi:hypothetical protein